MMHKKVLFLSVIVVAFLSACATDNNLKPVTKEYTATAPEKGLVAFRIGYKTIHPENKFIDIPIQLSFNGADEAKENMIIKKFDVRSSEFETTAQPDYKKHDYIVEMVAGEYSTHPAKTGLYYALKSQPSVFTVKPGYITYIGQYDIEATAKERDLFSYQIRKRTSHTRDQKSKNLEEILSQYPDLQYEGILKQPASEGDYRMKEFVPQQQTIYVPPVKYKKTKYVYKKK